MYRRYPRVNYCPHPYFDPYYRRDWHDHCDRRYFYDYLYRDYYPYTNYYR